MELGRERQQCFDRVHDLGDAHRAAKHARPGTSRWLDRCSREENRLWIAVSLAKCFDVADPGVAECILIDDEQADQPAAGKLRLHHTRLADGARADRVVAGFAQRPAEERAPPLVWHDEEHARRQRAHDIDGFRSSARTYSSKSSCMIFIAGFASMLRNASSSPSSCMRFSQDLK